MPNHISYLSIDDGIVAKGTAIKDYRVCRVGRQYNGGVTRQMMRGHIVIGWIGFAGTVLEPFKDAILKGNFQMPGGIIVFSRFVI